MKTIGLLGGMSWESTATYYELLNRGVRDRLGGLHSASLVMASVDFAVIETMRANGDWEDAGLHLAWHAKGLENAGASCILICTSTMHKVYPAVQGSVSIPVLHIGDAAAAAARAAGYQTAGLLGTRCTMEQDFLVSRLSDTGLHVIVPPEADRDVICSGLCQGADASRLVQVVQRLKEAGAEAVILSCTEILLNEDNSPLPVLGTTFLHVQYALDWAMGLPAGTAFQTGG
jgi:aspartate racemase